MCCSSFNNKAEYISATECIKEALWIEGIMEELGMATSQVTAHCDSAMFLMKNAAHHERTKHIDVCLHFVRERSSRCSEDTQWG